MIEEINKLVLNLLKKINFGAQSHVRVNFNLKITISP